MAKKKRNLLIRLHENHPRSRGLLGAHFNIKERRSNIHTPPVYNSLSSAVNSLQLKSTKNVGILTNALLK